MSQNVALFQPLQMRSIQAKNRIWVSPMCQYSSENGHPTDWHLVHLGSRAVGGAGLVMVEATAVVPEGRISPSDSGMWLDEHVGSFRRITEFLKFHGAVAAIQLAHAGRKASTHVPWKGRGAVTVAEGGWQPVGPSAVAFSSHYPVPRVMDSTDLQKVITAFEQATERSLRAGFEVVEIHMAHGYLLHEFLSTLSNQRQDEFGGSLENRMRFPLAVAEAVRKKWPSELPLFVRISATDWAEPGVASWNLEESIVFSKRLKTLGVELIDCSSGGLTSDAKIPVKPNYQVPFAEAIRREAKILTAAVGLITEPKQAEAVLREEKADAVFLARKFLNDPYWAIRAAVELGAADQRPNQYLRS